VRVRGAGAVLADIELERAAPDVLTRQRCRERWHGGLATGPTGRKARSRRRAPFRAGARMKRTLQLSDDLALPADAVTETFALIAVRGAGKTNAARVMAEEMFAAGAPFVAVDPVGSWWGLRAGRNGKPGGIPIPIFGGEHGDVPLERGGGQLVADLIVDQNVSCVLDLSGFESEAAKRAFLLAFAQRLYHRNRTPRHLFLEECDDYVPQRPQHDEAQLLRAWENIVRRGRSRGLGMTLITQRSAVVNKNVLTQVGTLITLRTTSPQDRAAVEAWIQFHDQKEDVLASLAELADGEAWIWSPHLLKETKRIRFRASTTFDSGATPKLGASPAKAATLADVDMAGLQKRMAATIERAKAEDPKALQTEVARLKRELASKPAPAAPKVQRVEVPAVKDAQIARIEAVAAKLTKAVEALHVIKSIAVAHCPRGHEPEKAPPARALPAHAERGTKGAVRPAPASGAAAAALGRCERALLSVLAQHGACNRVKLAILSGYSPSSSGFDNAIGKLRAAGFITPANHDPIGIYSDGHEAIGQVEPLPSGQALVDHWLGKLSKCERAIVTALIRAPAGLTKAELAEAAGYSPTSSGFDNAVGALRSIELLSPAGQNPIRLCGDLLVAAGAA
jgi:hypothetical protein